MRWAARARLAPGAGGGAREAFSRQGRPTSHNPRNAPTTTLPRRRSKAIWAQSKPMNDEELLFEQVKLTTSASPETTVWVYR